MAATISPATRRHLAPVAWVGLVALGAALVRFGPGRNPDAHVNAAPFTGAWHPLLTARIVLPLVVGGVVVWWGPEAARRLPFRRLAVATAGAAVVWAVALAFVDGPHALTAPLASRYDYLHDVARVGSPLPFLRSFVADLPTYVAHVRGHPPGMVLAFWALARLGLGGAGWAAALVLVTGASGAAAVLVAAREIAGEDTARRAAPFVVLVPAAVWAATSADYLFAGVLAWGVALVVLRRPAIGGVVLGVGLLLTYGAVPVVILAVVVLGARRRFDDLLPLAAGIAAVLAVAALAGFWWPAGLVATAHEYGRGASRLRPYGVFVVANLAVLAVATGPAVAAGLRRLERNRGLVGLCGATLVAVALADVSGLSKAEVERIWLPFVPWLALAGAEAGPGWLPVQAATGVALQVMLRSPW